MSASWLPGIAGSTPKPVNKVASGGELSRMALAIAVTTSQLGTAQTLIFDEVDSGMGGAVADTVGRLMKQLGVDRQVLAVTHLPQVAACADHHLVVAKQLLGKRQFKLSDHCTGRATSGRSGTHARRRKASWKPPWPCKGNAANTDK
jgi:DNA repair ATPase RecN